MSPAARVPSCPPTARVLGPDDRALVDLRDRDRPAWRIYRRRGRQADGAHGPVGWRPRIDADGAVDSNRACDFLVAVGGHDGVGEGITVPTPRELDGAEQLPR